MLVAKSLESLEGQRCWPNSGFGMVPLIKCSECIGSGTLAEQLLIAVFAGDRRTQMDLIAESVPWTFRL